MLQQESRLRVADNTGAGGALYSGIGRYKRRYASSETDRCLDQGSLGRNVKGQVSTAVVVRTKKEVRRPDGSYIHFHDNACVLLNTWRNARTRVFGPVAHRTQGQTA